MPLLWDAKLEQANVRQRLHKLGLPRAAIYAIGCATHSRDAVLSCQPPALHPTFQKMSNLLDEFWGHYPNSLRSENMARIRDLAYDILPDEKHRTNEYLAAEDVWMDGVAYAFSSATTGDYNEKTELRVLNAVDRAYIFVYTFHHELDQQPESEDQIQTIERHSKFCLPEIDFQLAFLSVLEAIQGQPPPYPAILQEMARGN
jgi:hypothetical protein